MKYIKGDLLGKREGSENEAFPRRKTLLILAKNTSLNFNRYIFNTKSLYILFYKKSSGECDSYLSKNK